jgi:hypothetical protein
MQTPYHVDTGRVGCQRRVAAGLASSGFRFRPLEAPSDLFFHLPDQRITEQVGTGPGLEG